MNRGNRRPAVSVEPPQAPPAEAHVGLRARSALAWALASVLVACAAPERDPVVTQSIPREAPEYYASIEASREARIDTLVERADRVARGQTRDESIDILMLSGGADWGAFGAGYLAGWSELGDTATLPMPEFDVIGGISTGALIATYMISQSPHRYAEIEHFYRNTNTNWIEFRGLERLLPNSTSVLDNRRIREAVAAALDESLIADLRDAHAEQRQLLVGTTNLDYGRLQYWDMDTEAVGASNPEPRLVDILMAATAIPGLFPPVEIDGSLHVDGGAVQGIPAIDIRAIPRLAERWRETHGDRPPPPVRVWWIYNNQVQLAPEAVGLSWLDAAYRSYQTISQTSFKAPLERNLLVAQAFRDAEMPAIELRWVAIPDSFVPDPDLEPFDPITTNALADLGREVAARPDGGWRTDLPD